MYAGNSNTVIEQAEDKVTNNVASDADEVNNNNNNNISHWG